MSVSEFDYELPEERIAKHPPKVRGVSRLLVLRGEELVDSRYARLDEWLSPGDVLVLNDTKVFPARVKVTDEGGRVRDLMVLGKTQALYRGEKVHVGGDLLALAAEVGEVPLPPYLKREATEADTERYQTVFARAEGSAAAPTASLNMTEELLGRIREKGVEVCYLTLHVGLGTFLPIRVEKLDEHKMHEEYYEVPEETRAAIEAAKGGGGRVVAVGTTATRALEHAYSTGTMVGEADIFIYPGYRFKVVDGMLTNFHAPKSTVLMLAGAMAGWGRLMGAYEHAIREKYDFLSYGDSMLIFREG
ncbi:tRNA preQ1(34) S-adenosylmethionine ribosyltransferase-isomerase QueA [Candidatus Saccharibacteria bacterium]|nr:tRNA preQ1(34) S-adenosylmethionine ribosyltransferase-isomerase QueA [Candidatus Saccharibacteria bacterium]